MTLTTVAEYPSYMEADVALRDGSLAHIRPVRPSDEDAILEFLRSLPLEDRRMRFFGLGNNLTRTAHEEAVVDYDRSLGLLVTATPSDVIVGHAMYVVCGDSRAEVAFTIAPAYQARGLATLLLGALAQAASTRGIRTFQASVLPDNRRMLDVFRASGFSIDVRADAGVLEIGFPTQISGETLARFDERDEHASAGAVERLLHPRSVAVIGASRQPGSVGGAVVQNLIRAGFRGPIYPINPHADAVGGIPALPDIGAVSGAVDLAVIAVPAGRVMDVAEQCGRRRVRSLVVLTAGFAETSSDGSARQAELMRICRAYGMRMVGPNCLGVVNTDPAVRLNATFGSSTPLPGRVGMATQSGALALAAMDFAVARSLGFSSLVSMGNKADISGNDLLGYWHTDPRTDVVLLYLESFGNPRKFARLARSIGRTKPIVAVKSGRSAVGARATASHTGALLSASDVTVDALFRQAGVIRTDTLDEMLDVADLLIHQPLPQGNRVAIVTNVGGPAVMCADMCQSRGLEVPTLSASTRARLSEVLPAEASVLNPVDLLAAATAQQFTEAVRLVSDDDNVDAVITIFLAPLATQPADVARAIAAVVDETRRAKPVLAVFMSPDPVPSLNTQSGGRIPGYHTPEPAAIALSHAVRYAAWKRSPESRPRELAGVQPDAARTMIDAALAEGREWLDADEIRRVFGFYGVPMVEQRSVTTVDDAVAAAALLGGEVALKAVAPGLIHKSDAGGVQLHLAGAEAVRAAAVEMGAQLRRQAIEPQGFVVQRMAAKGVEMLIGVVHDPQFGPIVACGAGGTLVELLNDVSVRLTPLTAADADTMVRELRSFPLLEGYRGTPRVDTDALLDLVVRIATLVDNHPQIAELDCNPVIVSTTGACVVDARMRITRSTPERPFAARTR